MGLFSSIKIAPGVRISTSGRGPRAHIGPRVARLHVGGGGSGVSTGAGPFTMYSGLGSPRRSSARTPSRSGMTPAQVEKARQVDENAQAWAALSELHRLSFPMATDPGAVLAKPVPMFKVLVATAERRHLAGVGRFDRAARQEARQRARVEAEGEALALLSQGTSEWRERQRASDEAWAAVRRGDPVAVATAVDAALSARGLDVVVTSTAVGVASLVLHVSDEEGIPTHQPGVTPGGKPTLKKLTKTETALQVRHLVAARVLLAVKETFAQSPAISAVDVAAARGREVVMRTHIERTALGSAHWERSAWDVLEAVDPELETNIGGRTQELRALK